MSLPARLTLAALGLALVATSATAQRPDFSGTWTRVDSGQAGRGVAATGDAAFRRGDMGNGWGSPLAITQTANRLLVEVTYFSTYDLQPKVKYAYALDGTESKNVVMLSHESSTQRSTAAWEGAKLVISTKFAAPPGPGGRPRESELRQALSLDAAGALVIESTRSDITGGAPNTVVTTYTKR
jgi:hypothetical protein